MRQLTDDLLTWYDRARRDLPWRAAPGRRADPYAVWLSEIMLQQTTVATVKSYYATFMSRWPTLTALAQAPLDEVLAAWAGLGYYARARNLHACARLVAAEFDGRFPDTEKELLNLPGVGPYTAAAIAAIAFERPCVAQDGNVERVISRLFALTASQPRLKAEVDAHVRKFLSHERPGDFAQALMDLGAGVCTPRAPLCHACPLAKSCEGLRLGTPLAFPVKIPKAKKPHRRGASFVLRCGDAVLLRRRPEKGLLGGMMEFPSTPLETDTQHAHMSRHAPIRAAWRRLDATVTHVFTHFSMELTIFVAESAKSPSIAENCRWAKADRLDKEGLPTLMRKVADRAGLTRG
jgi:A/G-specific adenine glycosylase